LNPENVGAMQLLALQRFQRGEYREGEKVLWSMLAVLPAPQRRDVAEKFGGQLEGSGNPKAALQAFNFLAWAFATSPDPPRILDPEEAMKLARHILGVTKGQEPLALDTMAAAQADAGQYKEAVQAARAAIDLANSKGNKPLAEAISLRLQSYQQGKPYRCDLDGNDRP
jgi:cytochrome c-type biogenesis protein CcmH/NrfG